MNDAKESGAEYWRSLDALAGGEALRRHLEAEFSANDHEDGGGTRRRDFLKLMGASLALAGAGTSGCRRWPERLLAPHSERPEDRAPGSREHYASLFELNGVGRPVMVTAVDGRPIKIEGNAAHPIFGGTGRGPSDALTQAAILELYDPERSQRPMLRAADGKRVPKTFDDFVEALAPRLAKLRESGDAGLVVLSEASASPTLARLAAELKAAMPQALWYQWEAWSHDNEVEGARLAFGQPLRARLHLERAELVVALDADLLAGHANAVAHANAFATGRDPEAGSMSRLWVVEADHTVTGSNADHRVVAPASRVRGLVRALAKKLRLSVAGSPAALAPELEQELAPLAAELEAFRGRSLLMAGPGQAPEVHALCFAINHALGNVGTTIDFIAAEDRPTHLADIQALTERLEKGMVSNLIILGGNPVFDAPVDLGFGEALAGAELSVHLSLYDDETSQACTWHLPRAHWLEAWGDSRTWGGTLGIVQPLIRPLNAGKSAIEIAALLAGGEPAAGHELVRQTFAAGQGGLLSEPAWWRALHDGFVAASTPLPVTELTLATPIEWPLTGDRFGLELTFRPDAKLFDGRFANNGWLQELPDPLTKLTWDNALLIAPQTAREKSLAHGEMVRVSVGDQSLELPVFLMPGLARQTVALSLGYGRRAAGHVGNGVGFDAYALRTSFGLHVRGGVTLTKLGRSHALATTQDHHPVDAIGAETIQHRAPHLIRAATLETYKAQPDFANHHNPHHPPDTLQPFDEPVKPEGPQWGMVIDLARCTGCGACTLACQAENNIAVVGKSQVLMSRELHWLRVDRYFQGDPESAEVRAVHQPLACHHCENAPCEQVCPVGATMHDSEGLNVQVYNRCIGTRYCSNNCPYKARRFNYFDYHARDPRLGNDTPPHLGIPDSRLQNVDATTRLRHNPQVTVRQRGIMEKCTFCTQRLQAAKIDANKEEAKGERPDHRVRDGEAITACQQACPSGAILFGDLSDAQSAVAKAAELPRRYGLLTHLNTRPRLQYLAKVTNPKKAKG